MVAAAHSRFDASVLPGLAARLQSVLEERKAAWAAANLAKEQREAVETRIRQMLKKCTDTCCQRLDLNDVAGSLRILNDRGIALRKQLEDIRSQHAQMSREVDLDGMERVQNEMRMKLMERDETLRRGNIDHVLLMVDLARRECSLRSRKVVMERLRGELADSEAKVSSTVAARDRAQEAMRTVTVEVDAMRKALMEAEESRALLSREQDDLRDELQRLSAALTAADEEYKRMMATRRSTEQQLQEYRKTVRCHEEELRSLGAELDGMGAVDEGALVLEEAALARQLSEATCKRDGLQEKLRTARRRESEAVKNREVDVVGVPDAWRTPKMTRTERDKLTQGVRSMWLVDD